MPDKMDDPLGLGPDWWTTRPPAPEDPADDGGRDDSLHGSPEYGSPEYDAPEYDAPPDGWFDEYEAGEATPGPARGQGPSVPRAEPDDPEVISSTIRRCLAAVEGQPSATVSSMVGRILAATDVLGDLDESANRCWRSLLEGVIFECSLLDGVGVVHLGELPTARFLSDDARRELDAVCALAVTGEVPENPGVEFEALVEAHQGSRTKRAALKLVRTIEDRAPSSEKMQAYRDLPAPTRVQEVANNNWSRSAAEWDQHDESTKGTGHELIISSGWPTLDRAATGTGEAPGVFKPGEFWVIAAGTGHGKSSGGRRLLTAAAQDLVHGWGLPHARALLCFTEEEAPDIARAAMLRRGQPFHHLAHNVQLAKVGESRQRVAQVVYDSVASAVRWAWETGGNVRDALPFIMFVDYVQGIKEPGENADTEGVARTADMLMRGVAAFDPDMIASTSGLDFQAYTGMPWPDGVDDHRVAVVVFSQLRKEGTDVWYREGKSSISDFTVVDASGQPCWTPQENDYAIPDRSDLRGSGVLLNHATGLVFFHRSRPTAPLVRNPDGSVVGLSDTRARFILAKARKSVSMPYVPMRFDSNPEGYRGQFYDDLGHRHCVVGGRMRIQTDAYRQEGDPILPERPRRSPFNRIPY